MVKLVLKRLMPTRCVVKKLPVWLLRLFRLATPSLVTRAAVLVELRVAVKPDGMIDQNGAERDGEGIGEARVAADGECLYSIHVGPQGKSDVLEAGGAGINAADGREADPIRRSLDVVMTVRGGVPGQTDEPNTSVGG